MLGVGVALLGGCAGAQQAAQAPTPGVMTRTTFTSAEGTRDVGVYAVAGARALVVMLHGCGQSVEDMARGTRMNAAADAGKFTVIYPQQPASANPQQCWNWFVPEQVARGKGEVALLAAIADSFARASGIPASRVSLVGMSAGAAMAANLAVAYPERFAALGLHSGIAALAAKDVMSAVVAMQKGAVDGEALGKAALAAMGSRARPIPVIALQGSTDVIVAPANLAALGQQWTTINAGAPGTKVQVVVSLLQGVGHAWSGGSAEGTFTAPKGPDATGMIVEFLRVAGAI